MMTKMTNRLVIAIIVIVFCYPTTCTNSMVEAYSRHGKTSITTPQKAMKENNREAINTDITPPKLTSMRICQIAKLNNQQHLVNDYL